MPHDSDLQLEDKCLRAILKYLDLKCVLNLRVTSRQLNAIACDVIKHRCKSIPVNIALTRGIYGIFSSQAPSIFSIPASHGPCNMANLSGKELDPDLHLILSSIPTNVQIRPDSGHIQGLPDNIRQISHGTSYSAALTDDGKVYVWKHNPFASSGQFPLAVAKHLKELRNIWQISAGYHHNLALTRSGEVFAWGNNNFGQCGCAGPGSIPEPKKIEELPNNICQISTSAYHNLALTRNGEVFAWGNNDFGQCGCAGRGSISVPQKIQGLPNNIRQIRVGHRHSVALTKDNTLYIWGYDHQPAPMSWPYLSKLVEIGSYDLPQAYQRQLNATKIQAYWRTRKNFVTYNGRLFRQIWLSYNGRRFRQTWL